jgi:hypothetical protein
MENARPREKLAEGVSNLFVDPRVVAGEKNGSIGLSSFADRHPVKVSAAIASKTETLRIRQKFQITGVFLAFRVEGQKVFDPFARFLRILPWRTNVELLAQDQFSVGIESEEPLGQERT